MVFDIAAYSSIAHLSREDRCANHLRAELGYGEAAREGEEGAGKGKSGGDIAEPEAEPNCGKQERHCYAPIGLIGEGKIGDDPAGKHDGKP
jgi:hypothetical protein